MLNRKLIVLFVVIVVSIIFLITCSKNPTGPDEPLETILSDMTIVIDPNEIPIIEFAENHITFENNNTPEMILFLAALIPDIILVCPPCDAAPYGFLRKITGVKNRGRDTEVGTQEGTLEETYEQLDLEETTQLDPDSVRTKRVFVDGITIIKGRKDRLSFDHDFNFNIPINEFVDVEVDGSFSFQQSFDFLVKIGWKDWGVRLKKCHFTTETEEDIDLDVTLNGYFDFSNETTEWDTTLLEYEFNPIRYGLIWLYPKVSLVLNIDATGQASISTQITQDLHLEAGVKYTRPNWSIPFDIAKKEFDYTDPNGSMSANLQAGVGPKLDVLLYNVAGPFVNLSGYLEFDANTEEIPWWTLYAGIKSDGGINMDKIGFIDDFSAPIFDGKWELASAPDNQCVTPTFDPPGGQYITAQNVTISTITENAEIKYTKDGSEPNINSLVYEGPLEIFSDITLKAKAFKHDWLESEISVANYSFNLIECIYVEGGTYPMGDHYNEGFPDEFPVHEVMISSFWIGKYEVTVAQFIKFLNDFGIEPDGQYNELPLVALGGVNSAIRYSNESFIFDNSGYSWVMSENCPQATIHGYGAILFCNWMSEQTGLSPCYDLTDWSCNFEANGYRMPTEAEWEYAARGGIHHTDNFQFSGCNIENLEEYAWINSNCNVSLHNVGTKLPNQLGIYDMSGNVEEMCFDFYSDTYYQESYNQGIVIDPKGPVADTDTYHVTRDGGVYYDEDGNRVSRRSSCGFDFNCGNWETLGFRVVRKAQ